MGAMIAIREGGAGSGNFGHPGNSPNVGGSGPSKGLEYFKPRDNSFGSQDNRHSYEPPIKTKSPLPDPNASDEELMKWAAKDTGAMKMRNGQYAIKGAHHWLVLSDVQLIQYAAGDLVAPKRMPSNWSPFPSTPKEAIRIERRITISEGGPGSGYTGHPGRPGMVGGSTGSGVSHITVGKPRGAAGTGKVWVQVFTNDRKVWKAMAAHPKAPPGFKYQKRAEGWFLWKPAGGKREPKAPKITIAPRAAAGQKLVDSPPNTAKYGRESPIETSMQNTGITKDAQLHGDNISETYKITFQDGSQAIFKPDSGEYEGARENITDGYSSQREVGAWELAQIVGMDDLVQPAAFRTIRGEPGSLEAWVQGGKEAADVGHNDMYDGATNAARAAAFDFVIGNEDRHAGNWMVTSDGNMHLIDHNLAFPDAGAYGSEDGNHNFVDHMAYGVAAASSPHDLAAAYVGHEDEIRTTLSQVGLPKASITGVIQRIGLLDKATSWSSLGTDEFGEESMRPSEEEYRSSSRSPRTVGGGSWWGKELQ